MPPVPPEDPGGQMTFFEHLVELRKRIITSLIAVGDWRGDWVVCGAAISFHWITKPMLKALADQHLTQQLVYTNPTGYLSLLITLSIYLGLVMASPVVLYQFWLFVAPALYKHEKQCYDGIFVCDGDFVFGWDCFRIFHDVAEGAEVFDWVSGAGGAADQHQ